jgi:hypothetical protein
MIKISKQRDKTIVPQVPEIFWIEPDPYCVKNKKVKPSNYHRSYRLLENFIYYYNCKPYLVSRYRKGLIGTECWVCLDTSNGNPEIYSAMFYCWVFKSKEKAEQAYQLHNTTKTYAKLKKPVKCVIVDKYYVGQQEYEE